MLPFAFDRALLALTENTEAAEPLFQLQPAMKQRYDLLLMSGLTFDGFKPGTEHLSNFNGFSAPNFVFFWRQKTERV